MADKNLIARKLLSDLQRDFGLSAAQAAGVAGNLMHESANFTKMDEVGRGTGSGYGQWTGARKTAFLNYAKANDLDPKSYDANYGYLKHEVETDPYERSQFLKVKQADNAEQAARLVSENYLRPGTPRLARRITNANYVMGLADQPVPPGNLPEVATLTDTVGPRIAPTPVTPSIDTMLMRNPINSVEAQRAQVTLPIPSFGPMGTIDASSFYSGIIPAKPGPNEAAKTNRGPVLTLSQDGRRPIGLSSPGNLDLNARKVFNDGNGGYRTENSISIGTDNGEVLIPTVVNGQQLSEQEAIAHYQQTGENLGTFRTPAAADRYAENLHLRQEQKYAPTPGPVESTKTNRVRPSVVPPTNMVDASFSAANNAVNPALAAALNRPVPASPSLPLASARAAQTAVDPGLQAALVRQTQRVKLPPIAPANPSNIIDGSIAATQTAIDPALRAALAPRPQTQSVPFASARSAQSVVDSGLQAALQQRVASGVGQPPATRTVQSVKVPALRPSIPMSYAGQDRSAPYDIPAPIPQSYAAQDRSAPYSIPERLAASAPGLPANYGTIDPLLAYSVGTPVSNEVDATGRRVTIPPAVRAINTASAPVPLPRPNFGSGGVDITPVIPPAASPVRSASAVAPTPMARPARTAMIPGTSLPVPGILGGFMTAMNNAGGPYNNGFDNLVYNTMRGGNFNTPGAATATGAGYLLAPNPNGGWINVGRDPNTYAQTRRNTPSAWTTGDDWWDRVTGREGDGTSVARSISL